MKKFFAAICYLFFVSCIVTEAANEKDATRKLKTVQIPQTELNFKFDSLKTFWFSNQNEFKDFWKSNSRNQNAEAPEIPVDWTSEALLAVFWPSEDTVVRMPAFMGLETIKATTGVKTGRLNFVLNTPCLGIITDQSPVQFIVIDRDLADFDTLAVRTENTKTINCF